MGLGDPGGRGGLCRKGCSRLGFRIPQPGGDGLRMPREVPQAKRLRIEFCQGDMSNLRSLAEFDDCIKDPAFRSSIKETRKWEHRKRRPP
jgi:hypothetical protein